MATGLWHLISCIYTNTQLHSVGMHPKWTCQKSLFDSFWLIHPGKIDSPHCQSQFCVKATSRPQFNQNFTRNPIRGSIHHRQWPMWVALSRYFQENLPTKLDNGKRNLQLRISQTATRLWNVPSKQGIHVVNQTERTQYSQSKWNIITKFEPK